MRTFCLTILMAISAHSLFGQESIQGFPYLEKTMGKSEMKTTFYPSLGEVKAKINDVFVEFEIRPEAFEELDVKKLFDTNRYVYSADKNKFHWPFLFSCLEKDQIITLASVSLEERFTNRFKYKIDPKNKDQVCIYRRDNSQWKLIVKVEMNGSSAYTPGEVAFMALLSIGVTNMDYFPQKNCR